MTDTRDDFLIRLSASRHPVENILVQFSVLSLVIMIILGVVISVILTTRLNRDFEILKENTVQVDPGLVDLDTDLNLLRWTVYVSVGGGFVILYTGLIWIAWRGWRTITTQQDQLLSTNSDLRAAYRDVKQTQEKLVYTQRLAASSLMAGKEQERKRLAEELHDDTMADLASVVVDLGIASRQSEGLPPEVDEDLARIRGRIRGTEQRLRQIVQGIFPSVLTNLGLVSALRAHFEELSGQQVDARQEMELELSAEGLDNGRLPEDVEIAVYRVVQQGITNAIQHANPDKLRVDLKWTGNELALAIVDDGVGFNPKSMDQMQPTQKPAVLLGG